MLPGFIKPAKLLKLAGVVAVAIAISACWGGKPGANEAAPTPSASQNATPAPRQTARGEMGWVLGDGTQAKMGDYEGKVLVLDFYATWCEPCRDSIPKLIALQKTYGPRGLQIVGLNVGGPDDRVLVTDFARELGITYPLGFPNKALTDFFLPGGDIAIPQTLIFGRDGKLVNKFEGYDESVGSDLERVINDELAIQQ
jgi:thiol-disulfide isomerase/thioredoxin